LICWAAKNFISTTTNNSYEGGLAFDISNVKDIETGTIKITLDYDTYTIEIYNEDDLIHTFNNIYALDLITTIGNKIGY
jgi:rRNA processing protein Krr1/Pno1